MAHRHTAAESQFSGYQWCVNPWDCSPQAHGNIETIETCNCGARRQINQNGPFEERSKWTKPEPKETTQTHYAPLKLRSYSLDELIYAQRNGETMWALDTANFGEDDTLIGSTENEIKDIVCGFHELDEFPSTWSLDRIDYLITKDK